MLAEAADLTRIRGSGRTPLDEEDWRGGEDAVGRDAGLGRDARLSFRTTIVDG